MMTRVISPRSILPYGLMEFRNGRARHVVIICRPLDRILRAKPARQNGSHYDGDESHARGYTTLCEATELSKSLASSPAPLADRYHQDRD
jgi:hypothetical protein